MNQAATFLEEATMRHDRARRRVQRSDELAYTAWQLIAKSRQRAAHRRRIAGGAGDGLRDRIRARLVGGTLPRVDGHAWAGKGTGVNVCACCGDVIARGEPEYEPHALAGLHAHARCFTIWLAESVAMGALEQRSETGRLQQTG